MVLFRSGPSHGKQDQTGQKFEWSGAQSWENRLITTYVLIHFLFSTHQYLPWTLCCIVGIIMMSKQDVLRSRPSSTGGHAPLPIRAARHASENSIESSEHPNSSLAPCRPVALTIQAFRDGYTYY